MRLITDILRQIRRGQALDQMTRMFDEVKTAVIETHKAGSVTLELSIKPDKDPQAVRLSPVLKMKKPQPDQAESIFFVDADGELHREDPRQGAMFEAANEREREVA